MLIVTDSVKNIVGPQIRKWRYARGWSQARLAVKLQLNGLDISREVSPRWNEVDPKNWTTS